MSHNDTYPYDYGFDLVTQEQVKEAPLYSSVDRILKNGINNLYPNEVEAAINNSPVATLCANEYQVFLKGSGFNVPDINIGINSWEFYSANDLLSDVCHSISRHGGVFIHVTYDGNLAKRRFEVLPYQNCRIGKIDDQGYISNIVYRPKGWSRRNYYNGFTQNTKNTKELYLPYNPSPDVLLDQIEASGGIEQFNGQVLYFRLEKKYPYSRGLIDPAIESALVDAELCKYYYNIVRGGFQDVKLIRYNRFKTDRAKEEFKRTINEMTGAKHAHSIMLLQDELNERNKEGNFRVEDLGSNVDTSKYEHIESVSRAKLRQAFLNIPHQLVEKTPGQLANTSDLREAISIYNTYTADHRTKIERLFRELFDGFYYTRQGIATPFPVLTNIGVYRLLDDGSIGENNNITADSGTDN